MVYSDINKLFGTTNIEAFSDQGVVMSPVVLLIYVV
jgi:hypothetical protein